VAVCWNISGARKNLITFLFDEGWRFYAFMLVVLSGRLLIFPDRRD
jgi:hypothetical protein